MRPGRAVVRLDAKNGSLSSGLARKTVKPETSKHLGERIVKHLSKAEVEQPRPVTSPCQRACDPGWSGTSLALRGWGQPRSPGAAEA